MRVIAADWSGALAREHRHLVVAEVDPDSQRVVRLDPSTRAEATDLLLDAAGDGEVVAGLDFSFSLPCWWLEDRGIGSADELWADASRLEEWLRTCAPPFWGRPGRPRPPLPPTREYRVTELAAPRRPRSTFQIGGAGAVGTASLRGMPHLHRLRRAGMHIWPWDPWRPPVVTEVWPRLAIGTTVKSSAVARAAWVAAHRSSLSDRQASFVLASDDALDAAAAALALAASCGRTRAVPTHPAATLEGWIDGVAEPGGHPSAGIGVGAP